MRIYNNKKETTTMRITKGREAILTILSDSNVYHEPPPCSATSIEMELELNIDFYNLKQRMSIGQIHRTLRDLVNEGLITYEMRKVNYGMNCLPKNVRYYYLVGHENRNLLLKEFYEKMRKAANVNGFYFFGKQMEPALSLSEKVAFANELTELERKLKAEGNMERQLEIVPAAKSFVYGITDKFEF